MSYSRATPVKGFCTSTEPTAGSFLYDSDEKLSQMLSARALVASGLQALVSVRVTGTRSSVERKLSVRKSSFLTISTMAFLNSGVWL